jgi:hypothetical protein
MPKVVVPALVVRVLDLLPGPMGLLEIGATPLRKGGVLVLQQDVEHIADADRLHGAGGLAVGEVGPFDEAELD